MADKSVVVLGLPGSGKTTFLAALWHLVTSHEVDIKLQLVTLRSKNAEHLNRIANLWRQARRQARTSMADNRLVSMTLRADGGEPEEVTFPDTAGEAFLQMWEGRECDVEVAPLLSSPGVLFFVHADKISTARWVVDEKVESERLGIERDHERPQPWTPRLSPTQVQVVDLLQTLETPPLDVGPRRLALILSAWDKVAAEGKSPKDYLYGQMPLLGQFLDHGLSKGWLVRIYGVSAQGGDYDDENSQNVEAEKLRAIDLPSHRIQVVLGDSKSSDLTEPLQWLLT